MGISMGFWGDNMLQPLLSEATRASDEQTPLQLAIVEGCRPCHRAEAPARAKKGRHCQYRWLLDVGGSQHRC